MKPTITLLAIAPALALALALAACTTTPAAVPQDGFWNALSSHCGKAYAGRLVSTDARDADWAGKRMIAHWTQCSEDRVAIAFHVEDPQAQGGWNRSRTWLLSRDEVENASGVFPSFQLKHDHRHEGGEADAVTFYGGMTGGSGSGRARDFPVDEESIALLTREGLSASLTNVWRIEVDPASDADAIFAYQLTRENDPTRLFRVEFDATSPVAAPPPAWGW